MKNRIVLAAALLAALPAFAHDGHEHGGTPPVAPSYAAPPAREIKALSPQEQRGWMEGENMGMGRAAELNGYPAPMMVLEAVDSGTTDGTIVCWSVFSNAMRWRPPGTFAQISVGITQNCALTTDGTGVCWRAESIGRWCPPEGQFRRVTAGSQHSCGIRTDGTLACWGDDIGDLLRPPTGTFDDVSASFEYTCAVDTQGSLSCWADFPDRVPLPPSGSFVQVSAYGQPCALRRDGSVTCWSSTGSTAADPDAGPFASISTNADYGCGVKTDGTVQCWGANSAGAASPPPGTFLQVGAGGISFTCGVRRDGSAITGEAGFIIEKSRTGAAFSRVARSPAIEGGALPPVAGSAAGCEVLFGTEAAQILKGWSS